MERVEMPLLLGLWPGALNGCSGRRSMKCCLLHDCWCLPTQGGGVFCNPVSSAAPAKLRLLYEVAPLAFVVEAAGGASNNGEGSALLAAITTAEVRSQVALGSRAEVDRCLPALKSGL